MLTVTGLGGLIYQAIKTGSAANVDIPTTLKDVADTAEISLLNLAQRMFWENMEPQFPSHYTIIFLPSSVTSFLDVAGVIGNNLVSLLIRKMTVPMPSISYEKFNDKSYATDIKTPDFVTISFMEDGAGILRLMLSNWIAELAKYDNKSKEWEFVIDKKKGVKDAIIIPHTEMNTLSIPNSWIFLQGLRYSSMGSYDINFEDGSAPRVIDVTFAIDNVFFVFQKVVDLL